MSIRNGGGPVRHSQSLGNNLDCTYVPVTRMMHYLGKPRKTAQPTILGVVSSRQFQIIDRLGQHWVATPSYIYRYVDTQWHIPLPRF